MAKKLYNTSQLARIAHKNDTETRDFLEKAGFAPVKIVTIGNRNFRSWSEDAYKHCQTYWDAATAKRAGKSARVIQDAKRQADTTTGVEETGRKYVEATVLIHGINALYEAMTETNKKLDKLIEIWEPHAVQSIQSVKE